MAKIDLTNKKYPYFTVISRNEERTRQNGKNVFWNCQCQCGKIFVATTTDINREKIKSCGCMASKLESQAHLQDLTGQVFGELKVLERDFTHPQSGKKPRTYWKCQCSCGNVISVGRDHLISRGQKSCGCKQSIGELNINKVLKENNILYKSQYTNQDLKTKNNGFLKFDFAIMDENNNIIRLIEFDGPQHNGSNFLDVNLEEIQNRDKQKNNYAISHNIPLVRIPYYKRDFITLEMLLGDQFLIN